MTSSVLEKAARIKASELGIPEGIMSCALEMISKNRNLVNAIDNRVEMDDYIYQAILKQAFQKRKSLAEENHESNDPVLQKQAAKELEVLSREEVTIDPFYRAVLPLMAKVLIDEPILRLHAEEASSIVLQLADFKRRHRSTSFTEVIVKHCSAEIGQ